MDTHTFHINPAAWPGAAHLALVTQHYRIHLDVTAGGAGSAVSGGGRGTTLSGATLIDARKSHRIVLLLLYLQSRDERLPPHTQNGLCSRVLSPAPPQSTNGDVTRHSFSGTHQTRLAHVSQRPLRSPFTQHLRPPASPLASTGLTASARIFRHFPQ